VDSKLKIEKGKAEGGGDDWVLDIIVCFTVVVSENVEN
jgi:hypothetical protein